VAAEIVTNLGGTAVDHSCSGTVGREPKGYDLAADSVVVADVDAVYFAGYAEEAARLVTALRTAGFAGKFIGDQGVRDSPLLQLAGDDATGVLVLASELPPTVEFSDGFIARFGVAPEKHAMETYESAAIMINAIGWGHVTDRDSMAAFVTNFDGYGSARHDRWDENGDLTNPDGWVHEVG
jgi:ABC-type branched-subunit amino acid transport system substrate-binding protein